MHQRTHMHQGNIQRKEIPDLPDVDVAALVVGGGKRFAQRHPVIATGYVLGIAGALCFTGFAVDMATADHYDATMAKAEHVTGSELHSALSQLSRADDEYYRTKGWFSCDSKCQQYKARRDQAEARVQQVAAERDAIISDARQAVGVWSVYSVNDVRKAFWKAWESGKGMAARMTMYDAVFMAMPGRREEGMGEVLIKLFFQYLSNLTIGLIASFVYFVYEVYRLVQTYGPSLVSGVAFFLLASCAGIAMVSTFLGGIFGAVGGGIYFAAKKAIEQQRLEQGRPQRRQMQYRSHYE